MIDIQQFIESATDKMCFVCRTPREQAKRGGKYIKLQGKQIWICATDAPAFGLARTIGQVELHQRVISKILSIPDNATGFSLKEEILDLVPPSRRDMLLQAEGALSVAERSPRQIFADLSNIVVGQESAKRTVSLTVYKHVKRCNNMLRDPNSPPNNILLVGPTGSGKTLIARTVAQSLAVPFTPADSTKFSPTGFQGQDTDQVIWDLYKRAKGNVDLAEHGVVFMDEIDKLAAYNSEGRLETMLSSTQSTLLRLMEGQDVQIGPSPMMAAMMGAETVTVNTTNMLWLLGGAFDGLEDIVAKELGYRGKQIGLRSDQRAAKVEQALEAHAILSNASQEVLQKSVIKYGLTRELVGRAPVIAVLAPLARAELLSCLSDTPQSPVKHAARLFAASEYALEFEQEALEHIVDRALKMETGTRALFTLVENAIGRAAFDLLDTAQQIKKTSLGSIRATIKITRATIDDPTAYVLSRRRRKKTPVVQSKAPDTRLPLITTTQTA